MKYWWTYRRSSWMISTPGCIRWRRLFQQRQSLEPVWRMSKLRLKLTRYAYLMNEIPLNIGEKFQDFFQIGHFSAPFVSWQFQVDKFTIFTRLCNLQDLWQICLTSDQAIQGRSPSQSRVVFGKEVWYGGVPWCRKTNVDGRVSTQKWKHWKV